MAIMQIILPLLVLIFGLQVAVSLPYENKDLEEESPITVTTEIIPNDQPQNDTSANEEILENVEVITGIDADRVHIIEAPIFPSIPLPLSEPFLPSHIPFVLPATEFVTLANNEKVEEPSSSIIPILLSQKPDEISSEGTSIDLPDEASDSEPNTTSTPKPKIVSTTVTPDVENDPANTVSLKNEYSKSSKITNNTKGDTSKTEIETIPITDNGLENNVANKTGDTELLIIKEAITKAVAAALASSGIGPIDLLITQPTTITEENSETTAFAATAKSLNSEDKVYANAVKQALNRLFESEFFKTKSWLNKKNTEFDSKSKTTNGTNPEQHNNLDSKSNKRIFLVPKEEIKEEQNVSSESKTKNENTSDEEDLKDASDEENEEQDKIDEENEEENKLDEENEEEKVSEDKQELHFAKEVKQNLEQNLNDSKLQNQDMDLNKRQEHENVKDKKHVLCIPNVHLVEVRDQEKHSNLEQVQNLSQEQELNDVNVQSDKHDFKESKDQVHLQNEKSASSDLMQCNDVETIKNQIKSEGQEQDQEHMTEMRQETLPINEDKVIDLKEMHNSAKIDKDMTNEQERPLELKQNQGRAGELVHDEQVLDKKKKKEILIPDNMEISSQEKISDKDKKPDSKTLNLKKEPKQEQTQDLTNVQETNTSKKQNKAHVVDIKEAENSSEDHKTDKTEIQNNEHVLNLKQILELEHALDLDNPQNLVQTENIIVQNQNEDSQDHEQVLSLDYSQYPPVVQDRNEVRVLELPMPKKIKDLAPKQNLQQEPMLDVFQDIEPTQEWSIVKNLLHDIDLVQELEQAKTIPVLDVLEEEQVIGDQYRELNRFLLDNPLLLASLSLFQDYLRNVLA